MSRRETSTVLQQVVQQIERKMYDAMQRQEQKTEHTLEVALRLQAEEMEQKMQEAMQLLEQKVERRLQEAMQLQALEMERTILEAMQQSEQMMARRPHVALQRGDTHEIMTVERDRIEMSRRTPSGGEGATAGQSAVVLGDAFRQVAHLQEGLARLQEGLRLQEQEAERRLQESLRLQEQEAERRLQEALRLQEARTHSALIEAVDRMERKLQEKDAAIRSLQQLLEERVSAVQGKAEEVEASLQKALKTFFPRVDELVRRLDESPPAGVAAGGEAEASVSGRGAAEAGRPQGPSAGQDVAVDDKQLHKERLQRRIDEVKRRMASPSTLGEDLMRAVRRRRLEEARRLLDAGAEVNYIDKDGQTPLHLAVSKRHDDVVALLLERGADVNAVNVQGSSAMHLAALYDRSGRCVDLLIGAGGDVDTRNKDGETPLHLAVISAHDDVVALLLERGADANAANVQGSSAMHLAALCHCSERCVDLLIAAGGDVDARNKVGETPLHWAAKWNNEAAVRALLAAGARRDLKAWDGSWENKTPIDVARYPRIRNLLRS